MSVIYGTLGMGPGRSVAYEHSLVLIWVCSGLILVGPTHGLRGNGYPSQRTKMDKPITI